MSAVDETHDTDSNSVDVKRAIQSASTFLRNVFADEDVRSIRLEEVEFDEASRRWLITLSFLRLVPSEEVSFAQRDIQEVLGSKYRREYKSVAVDAGTGEARSIKMRSAV